MLSFFHRQLTTQVFFLDRRTVQAERDPEESWTQRSTDVNILRKTHRRKQGETQITDAICRSTANLWKNRRNLLPGYPRQYPPRWEGAGSSETGYFWTRSRRLCPGRRCSPRRSPRPRNRCDCSWVCQGRPAPPHPRTRGFSSKFHTWFREIAWNNAIFTRNERKELR